jgi:hypothetical protein
MFLPSNNRTKAYKHYPKPRLTALTLAQYCTEQNAKERANIRQNARYQRIAGIVKNTDSRRAFQAYLGDIHRDRSILTKAHAALTTRAQSPLVTDFQRETALRNLENLRRFGECEQMLGLGGYGFERAPQNQPDLMIAGVPVSVQIDWLVAAQNRKDGEPQTGGALMQLAKGGALPDAAKREDTRAKRVAARTEINRLIAILIHQHLAENFPDRGHPARDKCLVIDPFSPGVYPVYGRLEYQVGQLEQAVAEIARLWDSIEAPTDYDG